MPGKKLVLLSGMSPSFLNMVLSCRTIMFLSCLELCGPVLSYASNHIANMSCIVSPAPSCLILPYYDVLAYVITFFCIALSCFVKSCLVQLYPLHSCLILSCPVLYIPACLPIPHAICLLHNIPLFIFCRPNCKILHSEIY